MRLERDVLVAGLDAKLARDVARACRGGQTVGAVARRVKLSEQETRRALVALHDEGFLALEPEGLPLDGVDVEYWMLTLRGAGLAMASLARPIGRAKASALLDGVIDRAFEYNARPDTPWAIAEVRVFGSYLDPAVAQLGDLDVALILEEREEGSAEWGLDYTYRSGRIFASLTDEVCWPRLEPAFVCRAGNGYISVHLEDITRFTDQWAVVYTRGEGRMPLEVAATG